MSVLHLQYTRVNNDFRKHLYFILKKTDLLVLCFYFITMI